jgi:xanthine dehydrogenase accessory factor
MAQDAKLLAHVGGGTWGTIGGGCTEADVVVQALATIRTRHPAVVRHTLNADLAGDVGLSCGGTAEFFLEPVVATADAATLYEAAADAVAHRRPATVRTARDWRDGPAKELRLGAETIALGRPIPAPPEPTNLDHPSLDDEYFVEPLPRVPRVLVFGVGHVGREIANLAARSGFYVVAVDDRPEFADATRLPGTDEVISDDFRQVLDALTLDGDDYVLATTRGHQFDAYIVERTAASAARYVGMLGSRRKKEVIWKALRDAGVPAEALSRVRVPIGEHIGADTPAEIAVSVVAELIRIRRLGESLREPA